MAKNKSATPEKYSAATNKKLSAATDKLVKKGVSYDIALQYSSLKIIREKEDLDAESEKEFKRLEQKIK